MSSRIVRAVLLLLVAASLGCPDKQEPPPDEGIKRCELDVMGRPELFTLDGSGASAFVIESDAQRIRGQFGQSRAGDFILENDRIRVAIDQAGRDTTSHVPFGGNLIDADIRRAGEGRDQLGKIGFLYSFGRALNVQKVEVLRDGSEGGPAIVAATGLDALNDRVTVQAAIDKQGLNVSLVIDPQKEVPLRGTSYFVLSPGEDRVRIVTALCNDGADPVLATFGDVSAGGGTMDMFNPAQCRGTLGEADCLVDSIPYFAWQGDGVAYGFRSYKVSDPSRADDNAGLYLSGSIAMLAGMKDLSGLSTWLDPQARVRPGAVVVRPGEPVNYVRDLVVARDLAEVGASWLRLDGAPRGTIELNVTRSGQAQSGARVAVEDAAGELITLAVTDSNGKAKATVAPGGYRLRAAVVGLPISAAQNVIVTDGQSTSATIELSPVRRLSITAKDPFGAPMPAKAVVRCKPGPCGWTSSSFANFQEIEVAPDDVAAIVYLPPQGAADLLLPAGQYDVMVTRGPEFSAWPETVPVSGFSADLTAADATANAVLARVVDSTGWTSADLHVHAVNSADASPSNESRVLSFLAEGVDTLVATDHEFVTDYRPVVQALGAASLISTIMGSEVSPDFGHQNAFPVVHDGTWSGGAFDWMGGLGPTLRPPQIWAGIHAQWPGSVIQFNHPRGNHGLLTNLKVDTLTSASHSDPLRDRMDPAPDATSTDTKLFATTFDVLEVVNGTGPNYAVFNDWMTFLSRGILRAGTAVSDTHAAYASGAGYSRTWVLTGGEDPAALDVPKFTEALKARRAVGSNTPFLSVAARRLDPSGNVIGGAAGVGELIGINKGAGEKLRFEVTVQAPEWVQFDRIELYAHANGREAWNGVANGEWPSTRILQTASLDPAALPVEAVPGNNGMTFRRVKVTHSFEVTPSADNWYVVMVRSTSAARDLFPLVFRTRCESGACTRTSSRAFAFSNPIVVDTDGNGEFNPPIGLTQPLRSPPPIVKPPAFVPTEEQAREILRKILAHDD